ncbi:MAG: hypothetical protein UW74_C0043G0004 [Candidatus Giovannonibacteria bacterium GW2011_GWC2_44_8]|uniref:Uncharacterized protein n=1 Tax=Candidatus Giovannonibacteria bacterium GW2011_GWC2_44_8 TaxID=1618657 RepID=A0A0G1K160_9BACT|nr:MAG: hypothetical protein UW74_C0043G0004 [Candidatus Giovannonibacteria bacterium GW2011_GWC2_44_8]
MNKAGIVDAVHAKISGTKKTAEDAVDAVFETITNALAKLRLWEFSCKAANSPRRGKSQDRPKDSNQRNKDPEIQSRKGAEGGGKVAIEIMNINLGSPGISYFLLY